MRKAIVVQCVKHEKMIPRDKAVEKRRTSDFRTRTHLQDIEMPIRKIRVNVYDVTGEKYTIHFQDGVTKDKTVRLLDLIELLGGMREFGKVHHWAWNKESLTKFERVRFIIEKYFPLTWFSSKEIQSTYEDEFENRICLSTVSTYLSRLTNHGFLIKNKQGKSIHYKLVTEIFKKFWFKEKLRIHKPLKYKPKHK